MHRSRLARASVDRSAFAGFRFPPEVITVAVRWYLRYGLSYRDVEELLVERGIEVDHVTVYRWVQRFTPLFADAARPLPLDGVRGLPTSRCDLRWRGHTAARRSCARAGCRPDRDPARRRRLAYGAAVGRSVNARGDRDYTLHGSGDEPLTSYLEDSTYGTWADARTSA